MVDSAVNDGEKGNYVQGETALEPWTRLGMRGCPRQTSKFNMEQPGKKKKRKGKEEKEDDGIMTHADAHHEVNRENGGSKGVTGSERVLYSRVEGKR